MKERPILFSAPMVRAILDGSKTQTRRVVKGAGDHILYWRRGEEDPRRWVAADGLTIGHVYCPYGESGDRLWVRETWARLCTEADHTCDEADGEHRLEYRADLSASCKDGPGGWEHGSEDPDRVVWRPSIYMPRKASRIDLEVTEVRIERLTDMSTRDCRAEGVRPVTPGVGGCSVDSERHRAIRPFRELWESINGVDSWATNPWVWVIEFKRLKP
jgi:hypothetical protein